MLKFKRLSKRVRSLVIGAAASAMVVGNVASVAALSDSSLSLSDPRPSQTGVTYTFDSSGFDTGTSLQCITLQLNDAANMGGSVPSAIDTTGAALDASGTLVTETNWTGAYGTNGLLQLTYGAGEVPAGSGSLVFTGIDNGDTDGTTYYAQLNTYSNIDCSTGLTDSATVAYVYKAGEPVSLTIDPTLTFTCVGVASSSAVNGGTTTAASTASGIDFGNNVTSSTNGISAHDLQVTTNASGGYVVYIRHTGQLTNGSSDTIDNHSGTNLTPSAFPAAGTEAWGYTTEDATLSAVGDGANRFTATGEYAGFTTSNEEVVVNTAAAPGTETTRVGHQVGVASTTEAGTYNTTIVYSIVATF